MLRLCRSIKHLATGKDSRLLTIWLSMLSTDRILLERWLLFIFRCNDFKRDWRILVHSVGTRRLVSRCRVSHSIEMRSEPGLYACLRFNLIALSLGRSVVEENKEVFLHLRSFFFFLSVDNYWVNFGLFFYRKSICDLSFLFWSSPSCVELDWVLRSTPELSHLYLFKLIGYQLCIFSSLLRLLFWNDNFVIRLHRIAIWICGLAHPWQLLTQQPDVSSLRPPVSPLACRVPSTFGRDIILLQSRQLTDRVLSTLVQDLHVLLSVFRNWNGLVWQLLPLR